MHVCEEFRERITEHIIGRTKPGRKSGSDPCFDKSGSDPDFRPDFWSDPDFGIQSELLLCQSCADFYAESTEMIEALSSVEFQVTEQQWDDMTHRLRLRIISENYNAPAPRRSRWVAWDFGIPALTAMAAVMLVTIGLYRLAAPIVEQPTQSTLAPLLDSLMDQPVILDPVTADFLEQSELLLRNVMKLEASNAEDVEEAKQLAMRHLINIDQRMAAAAGIRPVQTVMSKYETILRDLRNLNDETAAEDISDIQHRIERNGLIAGIKAFQPPAPVFDIDER